MRISDWSSDVCSSDLINETPILFTAVETAELIKYAANAFLATKITFINEIASLCEKVNVNVQDVARGIGLDGRIGGKFLHAGPGYGGSCFPKDTQALVATGRKYAAPLRIVETVVEVNDARKRQMAEKVIAASGGRVQGKRSEEHTSELQSLMRNSYAVFCLKKKKDKHTQAARIH